MPENPYDPIVAAASPSLRRSPAPKTPHLDLLADFAKENNLTVGSTTGGRHNTGSRHYTGNAIDIKGSGAFDDATVNTLKSSAASRGLLVRDERRRPPRQKVWGGPHIHVEYRGDDSPEQNPYDAIVQAAAPEPSPRTPAQRTGTLTDTQRPPRTLQGATIKPMRRWGTGTIGDGIQVPEVRVTPERAGGVGELRRLDDPETARILRVQRQVTSEQSPAERNLRLRPGATLLDARPSENEEVVSRASAEKTAEDETRRLMARRPEIDAMKAKLKEFAGQGHGARLIESVQGALANSGVQAGNLIGAVTLGRRGGDLTDKMRLAQIALGELEREDPDKGWIAAAERSLPGAAVELAKMSTLSRVPVAGRGTLPGLGVLSEADKGPTAAIKAGVEGEAFHRGFTKMAGLSKPAKFAVGTSVPAGIAIAQGEDPKKAILSNTAFGAMAVIGPEGKPRGVRNELRPEVEESQRDPVAYGTLREAARIAHENGWDTQAISRDAVRAAGARFSDPEDAAFMLDRFIKKESKPKRLQPKQIAPSPQGEAAVTAPKDAAMAADREALGLPELERLPTVSAPEVLESAKKANTADSRAPDMLVEQALKGGKSFTNVETMQVNLRAQEVKNRHAEVTKEIYEATDPDVIAEKRVESDALLAEYDRISEAQDKAGAEWARAGHARQRAIADDFSLVSMVSRAKKAKGRDLTVDERAKYEKQFEQITSLESQLAEANERAKTKSLQREIDKVKRTAKRQENKAVLDDEFASLRTQFAQAKIETRSGVQSAGLAGLDPEGKLTALVAKMARNRVKAGITDAAQLVDKVYSVVKEHVEGITKSDVHDLVMGFGFADPTNKRRQTQLLNQQVELSRRLAEGDFSKVKREPPVYNRETAGLQKQIDQIKQRYRKELYRATRSTGQRISDELAKAANVPKTIKSMGDISAVFRQGGFHALTHPIAGLAKPSAAMVRSFTEAGNRNVNNIIKSDPAYETLKRGGVEFTGVDKTDPQLSHREEGYLGQDLIDYVPGVSHVGRFSERTFTSFLDAQRLHVGKVMLQGLTDPGLIARTLGRVKPIERSSAEYSQEVKSLSSLINIGTGRGSLGKYNNAAPFLNIFMFSPRLVASRVQLLNNMFNPAKMARMSRGARAQMIQDNVKFLTATVAVMTLAKAAGGTVNTDPDDGDFLKIRFGKTTYDTLVGLQQPLRYIVNMARAATGGETYAGKDMYEQTFGSKTRGGFLESKSSPLAGAVIESVRGADFSGRKRGVGERALDLVTPLPVRDFKEAMEKEGLIKGFVKAAPSLVGVGVQTYDQVPEPKTWAEKLAGKFKGGHVPNKPRTEEQIDTGRQVAALKLRARRGEDVSAELKELEGKIKDKQAKSVLRAANRSGFQEDFIGLTVKEALIVYRVADEARRAEVRDILERKTARISELPDDEQADLIRRMKELGMKPGVIGPKIRTPTTPQSGKPSNQGYVFQ